MRENNRLLLVGRDDWQKDEALNLALLQQLKNNRIEIIWEDPAAQMIHFFRKLEQKCKILSPRIKKCHLRLIQIVYGVLHPSYFVYLYKRKNNSVAFRCESLKKIIRKHGGATRTIVLARSSGGRVASLIADELNLKQIVCLGYPFKHPEQDDDPARYTHLATMKTPMLIIQGIHDEYGGIEIKTHYELSNNITLLFLNTDHNFTMDDIMAKDIVKHIECVLGVTQQSEC